MMKARLNYSERLSHQSDVQGSTIHSQTLLIDEHVVHLLLYELPHAKTETVVELRGDCPL